MNFKMKHDPARCRLCGKPMKLDSASGCLLWDKKKKLRSTLYFRCTETCGYLMWRPASPREQKIVQRDAEVEMRRMKEMHKLGWAYQKEFLKNDEFKYEGMEMLDRMERFAKKNPQVTLLRCDDSFHCSSNIALIPHENRKEYWGTTVVIMPQCHGHPEEIFLYPNHAIELHKALGKIVKKQAKNPKDD